MTCRSCGATIADKAIVCYRCGTATADPETLVPRRMPGAERHYPLWAFVAAGLTLALTLWLFPDVPWAPRLVYWTILIGLVLVMTILYLLNRRRSGRGRRLR